jgi:hypothetical protein
MVSGIVVNTFPVNRNPMMLAVAPVGEDQDYLPIAPDLFSSCGETPLGKEDLSVLGK